METTTLGAIAAAGVAAGGIAVCFAGNGEGLLRPPGAANEADFRARCIKCGRCLEACPYQAIRMVKGPTGAETGTPVIDARAQACRLCADFPCIAACPTEALHPVPARDEVRMGCAVINRDLCIAVQGMRCEVCYRACPLIDEAIVIDYRMRETLKVDQVIEPTGASLDELMAELSADDEVVRVKEIEFTPMTEEEAMIQIDLLGHDFLVYTDRDTNEVNVMYRRTEGGYGLLKPKAE